jgi:hypothetical protein
MSTTRLSSRGKTGFVHPSGTPQAAKRWLNHLPVLGVRLPPAGFRSRVDGLQFPGFLASEFLRLASGIPCVAIRGRVGDCVFKTYRDKIVVTRVPRFDGHKPSAAQRDQRAKLRAATGYARAVYADPAAKAVYVAAARKLGRQAFRLAVADFLRGCTRVTLDPGVEARRDCSARHERPWRPSLPRICGDESVPRRRVEVRRAKTIVAPRNQPDAGYRLIGRSSERFRPTHHGGSFFPRRPRFVRQLFPRRVQPASRRFGAQFRALSSVF